MDTQNFIEEMTYIEIEDIPNIELYMDQVTTFMDQALESYKRNKDDKILTKTMINNYAKAKLFPPPEKKKYTKNHMILLILIYHLKSVLSISDIQKFLAPINDTLKQDPSSDLLETIYKKFVKIQKEVSKDSLYENNTSFEQLEFIESDEKNKNILLILWLAVQSNTKKRLAEKILDHSF